MEIEFNTSRVAKSDASQTVSPRSPVKPVKEAMPFETTRALEQKLKEIPTVRSEKVERARELVSNVQYPPTELVDRIANLLAIHHAKKS